MQKTDFNRDWTVQKDGSNEILHVNLPDDAMIREERSKENKTASASAYFAGGKYIYTKIFDLSENETRQTLILEFEAVYQNATVFLNGRQVIGKCPVHGCQSEKGNADECDLGHQYMPSSLIDPKSTLTGETPVMRDVVNWYFRLTEYPKLLGEYVD